MRLQPGTTLDLNPVVKGAQYRATHKASVLAILGRDAPSVFSKGSKFFNADRWTARLLVQIMCKWAKKNPGCVPTKKDTTEWLDEVNAFLFPPEYRQIVIATTPDVLPMRTALALIGGAYHEALHTKYSCRRDLNMDEITQGVVARWAKVEDWSKYTKALLDWSNLIEDIRIERRGCEFFDGIFTKMCDLHDYLLNLEERRRAAYLAKTGRLPSAVSVVMCAFRDLGKGYPIPRQDIAMDQYNDINPEALALVVNGPLAPMVAESIVMADTDDLGSLFLAMDVIAKLVELANNDPNDPDTDPEDGEGENEQKCPKCGAPGSCLQVRPKSDGKGGKVHGKGVITCTKCGWQHEIDMKPEKKKKKSKPKEQPKENEPDVQGFDPSEYELDPADISDHGKEDPATEPPKKDQGKPDPKAPPESAKPEEPGDEDEGGEDAGGGEGEPESGGDEPGEGTEPGDAEGEGEGTEPGDEPGDTEGEGDGEGPGEGDEPGDEPGEDMGEGEGGKDAEGEGEGQGGGGEGDDEGTEGEGDGEGTEPGEGAGEGDGAGQGAGQGGDTPTDDDSAPGNDSSGEGAPGEGGSKPDDSKTPHDPSKAKDDSGQAGVGGTSAGGHLDKHEEVDNDWSNIADEVNKQNDAEDNTVVKDVSEGLEEGINTAVKKEDAVIPSLMEAPWRPYDTSMDNVQIVKPSRKGQERDAEDAAKILETVKEETAYLRSRLRVMVRSIEMNGVTRGVEKGRILSSRYLVDTRAAIVGGRMPKKAFDRQGENIDMTIACAVVLDESGSMGGLLRDSTRIMMAITEPLDALNAPTLVLGFRDGDFRMEPMPGDNGPYHRYTSVDYDIFKGFNERFKAVQWRFANTRAEGGTPMSDGIQFALNALSQRSEAHRFLFVVTDGCPNGGHLEVMNYQIRLAKEAGVHVIGVGIGGAAQYVTTVFPDSVWSEDVKSFPKALIKCLNDFIDVQASKRGRMVKDTSR